jgi:arylsulfatase A-like enzyme
VAALLAPAGACRLLRDDAPNIIFILVDTLRADYLGTYGFRGQVSPNVDRLAGESIVFRNCFSQSPWTKPAVASLFTSLYPQVHGLTNHEGRYWGTESPETSTGVLSDRATTLAERLRERGYDTAAFVSNPWITGAYGFAQGFDIYDDDQTDFVKSVAPLVDDARTWLESREGRAPYFLYLHFMDVHAPYSAPEDDFTALRGSPSVSADRLLLPGEMPDLRWKNIEVRADWATNEMRRGVAYWRTRYASGVRAFDRRLGELLDYLRQSGELDRSVVVFTSDHGEELFEHGDWSHGQNLFDHQLRVPLIVRNPLGRAGGFETEAFVELVDLMPTLLSVAGAEPPVGLQGRDVSAVLEGRAVEHPAITFATATQRSPGLYSARTADHKLIVDLDSTWERLFDLTRDQAEQQDASENQSHVADELRDRLLTHIVESVAAGTLEVGEVEISPDLQERLEALGYLR